MNSRLTLFLWAHSSSQPHPCLYCRSANFLFPSPPPIRRHSHYALLCAFALLPPVPPRAPADARGRQSVEQLQAREQPVHYFRLWLRESTASLEGRPQEEARLRDSACALFVFRTLRPGLLRLVNLLLGAFAVLVATGLCPFACVCRTGHGLAVALALVHAALQGRFGAPHCAARRAPRVHMRVAGIAAVVERRVARLRDRAPVPQRRAADWMPHIWWERPADRVLVVSRGLDVRCLGQARHFVGVTWDGGGAVLSLWACAGRGCRGGGAGDPAEDPPCGGVRVFPPAAARRRWRVAERAAPAPTHSMLGAASRWS